MDVVTNFSKALTMKERLVYFKSSNYEPIEKGDWRKKEKSLVSQGDRMEALHFWEISREGFELAILPLNKEVRKGLFVDIVEKSD